MKESSERVVVKIEIRVDSAEEKIENRVDSVEEKIIEKQRFRRRENSE